MKKKIIFLGEWWSVGESLFIVNLILNYCDYIKKNYKDQVHIIYNFLNEKFMYENVLDMDNVLTYADEIYFSHPDYYKHILNLNGYVQIFEWVYVHKNQLEFFKKVFKYNPENCWSKYEIFDEIFNMKHPTNIIRHDVEILYRDYEFNVDHNVEYPKPLVKINEKVKKIAREFINNNSLNDYEVIHFRWNNTFLNPCGPDVVNYLVDRLDEVLDKEKKYYVSTNYFYFVERVKTKFKNVVFIDRGDADFTLLESRKKINKGLPKFIDEKILEYNPTMDQISNFIAHVEMEIINNSKRVNHCSEISRNIISLFLWVPLLISNVELMWFGCTNNIIRKYDFNRCIYQIVLEKSKIKKPDCFKVISGGKFLDT